MKTKKLAAAFAVIYDVLFASGCAEATRSPQIGDVKHMTNENPFKNQFQVKREVIAISNGFMQVRTTWNDGVEITNSWPVKSGL